MSELLKKKSGGLEIRRSSITSWQVLQNYFRLDSLTFFLSKMNVDKQIFIAFRYKIVDSTFCIKFGPLICKAKNAKDIIAI